MSDLEEPFLRKKPQQSRSRALVNAVLEAADQLLGGAGKPDVPLERIADRAGVGIGSLYDYFANSEGVWGALVARLTKKNFEQLQQAVRETDALNLEEATRRICDATLDVYLQSPSQTRAVVMTLFRLGWLKPVVQERDAFATVLVKRIKHARPDLNEATAQLQCELLCDAMMGLVMGELWRERSATSTEAMREQARQLAVSWVQRIERG